MKKVTRSRIAVAALSAAGTLAVMISAAAAKEVTVWCWDPNFNGAVMKEAAARYTAAHPDFKLNVVDFGKKDLEQKLQATLASGVTDTLPDIVLIEDYGVQKYLMSFPGTFEPLNGKIDYTKFAPYKVELATGGRQDLQRAVRFRRHRPFLPQGLSRGGGLPAGRHAEPDLG